MIASDRGPRSLPTYVRAYTYVSIGVTFLFGDPVDSRLVGAWADTQVGSRGCIMDVVGIASIVGYRGVDVPEPQLACAHMRQHDSIT